MTFLLAEMLGLLIVAIVLGAGFATAISWLRWGRSGRGQTLSPEAWHATAPPPGSAERWASDLVAAEAELHVVHEDVQLLRAERVTLQAEVEQSVAGMRCQWEELVTSRRRIAELEADLGRVKAERISLERDLGAALQNVESAELGLALSADELSDRDATLSRLRSELFNRETELERVRSQGAAIGRQLVAFERELPVLRQRAARAEVEGSKVNTHLRELEANRRRLADLEHQLVDTVSVRNQLVEVREVESDVRARLAEKEMTLRFLRLRIVSLEDEIGALRVELAEANAPTKRPSWAPPIETAMSFGTGESVGGADLDDLKRIRGIGSVLERMLHHRGIMRISDLAALDDEAVDRLQNQLSGFPDRIRRDRWIEQANELVRRDTASGAG